MQPDISAKKTTFAMRLPAFFAATLIAMTATAAQAQTAACSAAPPTSYGDAPATINAGLPLLGQPDCRIPGSRRLTWTDPNGSARFACLLVPANASSQNRLPLVVWLHASLSAPGSVKITDLDTAYETADLTGDPARRGFLLLVPAGRRTSHFYPFPDNNGSGWDNWYRNLDRSSPALNVDVATVDHFIDEVKSLDLVDPKRVYMSGWSNGSALAQLYALNTPGIAAAAVYSSPDPYRDVQDPCAQTPFANTLTPLMDIHNSCDLFGICQTGQRFHEDLARLYPRLKQNAIIIDQNQNDTAACSASCASQSGLNSTALLRHSRWPTTRNEDIFRFLRENPLPTAAAAP